jgi:hypothetical protein
MVGALHKAKKSAVSDAMKRYSAGHSVQRDPKFLGSKNGTASPLPGL